MENLRQVPCMLHIKLKGMECIVPCKHIFCPNAHPLPLGWVGSKDQNFFFLNVVMLHFNFYTTNMEEKKTLTLHTPLTLGLAERSDIEIKRFY